MSPPAVLPEAPEGVRVLLLGKPGCHLCEDARAVVERVCAESAATYAEIDILTDPALADRWFEEIPVVAVDGAVLDVLGVDPVRLRAALAR
jgi:hypothetical protein